MKLDYVYFRNKMWDVFEMAHMGLNGPWYEIENAIEILRQIAVDAFEAGAKAQREMGVRAINDLIDNCGCCEVPSAEIVLAAINSATVKWEEK